MQYVSSRTSHVIQRDSCARPKSNCCSALLQKGIFLWPGSTLDRKLAIFAPPAYCGIGRGVQPLDTEVARILLASSQDITGRNIYPRVRDLASDKTVSQLRRKCSKRN
ncbi:hypothetical protein J6590_071984 [Homalodisca vitripennis]|nr:hypothetical protein J6590_071984 [Homalodisca vitripennis]